MATFAALAGVKAPSNIDGISFAPTLFGKKAAQKEHDYLYWEFYEKGGKQAVRQGDWKAVRVGLTKNAKAPIELYNLAKDDGEENNLAKANPEVVKRMAAIIKSASAPDPNYSFKPKPRKKSKNKSKGKARKQKKSK